MKPVSGLRILLVLGIWLALCPATLPAQHWECSECPPRHVIVYDFELPNEAEFAQSGGFAEWSELGFVADALLAALTEEDPSRECLIFLDGQLTDQLSEEAEEPPVVQAGPYWQNLPPSGEVEGGDYLLTGSISDRGGILATTVRIETAASRDVVLSETFEFLADESGLANGQRIGRLLPPLLQVIRGYEKRKRDADPGVAIYGTLRLHAEKRSIGEGESVPVGVRLVDCDGVPLGSRTVSLRAEGGSCATDAVETDDRGEATVVFTGGDASGWSSLYAEYVYDYPHGWGSVAASDELIFAVNQDTKGTCLVECTASETITVTSEQRSSFFVYGTEHEARSSTSTGHVWFRAVYPRMWNEEGELVLHKVEPLRFSVHGSWMEAGSAKDTQQLYGRMVPGSWFENYSSSMTPDRATFLFQHTSDYQHASLSAWGSAYKVSQHRKLRRTGWEAKTRTAAITEHVHALWSSPEDGGEVRFANGRMVFTVSTVERIEKKKGRSGMEIKTIERTLIGTIVPFDGGEY